MLASKVFEPRLQPVERLLALVVLGVRDGLGRGQRRVETRCFIFLAAVTVEALGADSLAAMGFSIGEDLAAEAAAVAHGARSSG